MAAIRWLLGKAAPAGPRGRLLVLIFHRVLARTDPLLPDEPDAERFDAICGWLRSWFNVLALDVAVARLREGALPERALAITFDDGYADNHDIAVPILQRHGLCATFFVATGFLDGGRMFNDTVIETVRRMSGDVLDLQGLAGFDAPRAYPVRTLEQKRQALISIIDAVKYLGNAERNAFAEGLEGRAESRLPDHLMMTSRQVIGLHRAGMGIGAHTVSHAILAGLSDTEANEEIFDSRRQLEGLIDAPVRLFAYPNGRPDRDYTLRTVDLVRSGGFEAAVSTAAGAAGSESDPFQIPRFTPWDRTRRRFGLRILRMLWTTRHDFETAGREGSRPD